MARTTKKTEQVSDEEKIAAVERLSQALELFCDG
jgi:hypothetical protein